MQANLYNLCPTAFLYTLLLISHKYLYQLKILLALQDSVVLYYLILFSGLLFSQRFFWSYNPPQLIESIHIKRRLYNLPSKLAKGEFVKRLNSTNELT